MNQKASSPQAEYTSDLICTLYVAWKHGDGIAAPDLQKIEAIVQDATGEPAEAL